MSALTRGNQAWAPAAPVLVLAAVRLTIEGDESQNPLAWYDAGQAVALLTVQATSQGLSVRQMEGFDREGARLALGVPVGFDPAVVMAIGYAGDPEALALEKHREAELQPRRRKAIGDFVFEDVWGRVFQAPTSSITRDSV